MLGVTSLFQPTQKIDSMLRNVEEIDGMLEVMTECIVKFEVILELQSLLGHCPVNIK